MAILILAVVIALGVSPLLGYCGNRSPFLFLVPVLTLELILMGIVIETGRMRPYPRCRRCRERIRINHMLRGPERDPEWITFKCNCGVSYRLAGRLFCELKDDESLIRYKRKSSFFGRWVDDV